jgi:hypothetical protein
MTGATTFTAADLDLHARLGIAQKERDRARVERAASFRPRRPMEST